MISMLRALGQEVQVYDLAELSSRCVLWQNTLLSSFIEHPLWISSPPKVIKISASPNLGELLGKADEMQRGNLVMDWCPI